MLSASCEGGPLYPIALAGQFIVRINSQSVGLAKIFICVCFARFNRLFQWYFALNFANLAAKFLPLELA